MFDLREEDSPSGYTGKLVGNFNTIYGDYLVFLEEKSGYFYVYQHASTYGKNEYGEHFYLEIDSTGAYDEIKKICMVKQFIKDRELIFTEEELEKEFR